jgi:MFS family permease
MISWLRIFTSDMDNSHRAAVLSLLFSRIIYAINWFNIASIFSLIASDFKQDISLLGMVSASFIIGIGIFQVPGGIIAARYGPRNTAICGIIIASSSALLCGLSTDFRQLIVLRFIVGIGMAFFFGPGVTLIVSYFGRQSAGFGVGLLNSAQAMGGIIGIFVWAIFAEVIGWKQSLIISGILGLVSGLSLVIGLPKEEEEEQKKVLHNTKFQIKISDLRKTLLEKSLIMIGIALLGVQIGWSLVLIFIVFYLQDSLKINHTLAGLVGSLPLIFSLISSPIAGKIYDSIKNTKMLLITSGLAMCIGIAINAINSLYTAIFSAIAVGFFAAWGFTIAYTLSREVNTVKAEYKTLSVSWVNGLSLSGAFWVPIGFAFVSNHLGYSVAWLLGGILTISLIAPIVMVKGISIPN